MTDRPGRLELDRTVVAGLAAGGLGALGASLVSLLVRSPDPTVANTATVSVVAGLVGIAAGLCWWAIGEPATTPRARVVWGLAGCALAVGVLAIFDAAAVDGLLGYGVAPAVVVFVAVAGSTPWFGRPVTPGWVRNVTTLAAVVVGALLAGSS